MARKYIATGYATYPSVKLQKLTTDPNTGKQTLSFIKELLFMPIYK